jgi:hypothetical protein
MKRPLADKRPVGPIFSQSDGFDRELIELNPSYHRRSGGIMLITTATESADREDLLNNVEGVINDLRPNLTLDFEDIGRLGKRDYAILFDVQSAEDPVLTTSQLEAEMVLETPATLVEDVNIYTAPDDDTLLV